MIPVASPSAKKSGSTLPILKKRTFFHRVTHSVWWAKISQWEFWPFSLFYAPVTVYWAWLTLKTRSFFFFTASNPGIHFGGMLGESKNKIYASMPQSSIPKTCLLSPGISIENFREKLKALNLTYPFILKPDIGERGWMVELIKNESNLGRYLEQIEVPFLIQEYIPFPIELGVFYYRYPNQPRGTVSSVVIKDMLSVTGNGRKTVRQLAEENVRAKMHLNTLEHKDPELLDTIPAHGESVELIPIGNHSRGTTFINGNHLINKELIDVMDNLSHQIDGFYFGRYDLRCSSMDELYKGENFKVLELNGAGAEPAHIYHPGFSIFQAYKDIIHHLRVLAKISRINHRNGHSYMSLAKGIKEVRKIQQYNKHKVS